MKMTMKQLRAEATKKGLRVWIANGTGKRGNPGYMGDVKIARLSDEGKEKDFYGSRFCDMQKKGYVEDVRYMTAWRGLISANRRALEYINELSK
jgi:hypothetical protein